MSIEPFIITRYMLVSIHYFPFEPDRYKKWLKIPFILKKWLQLYWIWTSISNISCAVLMGRPNWWKKNPEPFYSLLIFFKKEENKSPFSEALFFLYILLIISTQNFELSLWIIHFESSFWFIQCHILIFYPLTPNFFAFIPAHS